MDLDTLWIVADRAREKPRLAPKDVSFIRDVAPDQLDAFPKLKLPVIPVLEAGALRYFDCRDLSKSVKRLVRQREWRFAKSVDPRMVRWALGDRHNRH